MGFWQKKIKVKFWYATRGMKVEIWGKFWGFKGESERRYGMKVHSLKEMTEIKVEI